MLQPCLLPESRRSFLRENKGKTLKALHSVYSIAKMNYKYYDTPEGQDCFLKMGYLTKNAAIFGE